MRHPRPGQRGLAVNSYWRWQPRHAGVYWRQHLDNLFFSLASVRERRGWFLRTRPKRRGAGGREHPGIRHDDPEVLFLRRSNHCHEHNRYRNTWHGNTGLLPHRSIGFGGGRHGFQRRTPESAALPTLRPGAHRSGLHHPDRSRLHRAAQFGCTGEQFLTGVDGLPCQVL